MEKGKWIFLVNKLPTVVSPPAMSIHYAIPWPMEISKLSRSAIARLNRLRELLLGSGFVDEDELEAMDNKKLASFILQNDDVYDYLDETDSELMDFSCITGHDYYELKRLGGAMQIKFAGENIRVFPEEFSEVSLSNMKAYMEKFIFHPNDLWNGLSVKPTDPDEKFIFEAALLDGCNEYQATNIVNGGDINSVDDFPAPLGWYECPLDYGLYFGKTEEDMKPRYKEIV